VVVGPVLVVVVVGAEVVGGGFVVVVVLGVVVGVESWVTVWVWDARAPLPLVAVIV
jgi:hypothetical protein